MLRVGFIGLGNVGGKLAGSLLRNGIGPVQLRDLGKGPGGSGIGGGFDHGNSSRQAARPRAVYVKVPLRLAALASGS